MITKFLLQNVFLLAVVLQAAGCTCFANGSEQVIETTDSHPFWVVSESGSRYVDAKDLQVGNIFIGANGELTTLTVTNRVGYPDGITVYNFTVADNHNYFVVASLEAYQNGASVVLVHNANCGGSDSYVPKARDRYTNNMKSTHIYDKKDMDKVQKVTGMTDEDRLQFHERILADNATKARGTRIPYPQLLQLAREFMKGK